MHTDRRTVPIDRDTLSLIFERLYEKVLRRTEDDKHQAERHQRRAIDALRSKIKHLDPPILITDTWDQVRARVQNLEEYKALDSDDLRRSAFDKVIRRLKEKEEDAEKEREKEKERSKRDHRDSSHRDARNGHVSHRSTSGRHAVRTSRTPEPDAYEADRRKAQADRERQYRKSSATGLSPPPPDHRVRGDRHDRRSSRHGPPSHYDRERREREEEREKLYRTRGDPRGSRDELDYGENRMGGSTGSVRRRRGPDSDGESVGSGRRESKVCRYPFLPTVVETDTDKTLQKSRRDRTPRERSPPLRRKSRTPPAPVKEEPAVHSGSEEGEMVEED